MGIIGTCWFGMTRPVLTLSRSLNPLPAGAFFVFGGISGAERIGLEGNGRERSGNARLVSVRQDAARPRAARPGLAGRGAARRGEAWRGEARQVLASTKGLSSDGSFFIDTHLKFC